GLAIDQVAQTEPDRHSIDAGVGLVQPGHVPEAKLDLWLAPAGQVQHRGREVDPDNPARWSDKWHQLVSELPRAGTQVERRLARAERRALGGPPAPGAIAVRAEQAVPSVISGGHLVEPL